MDLHSQLHSSVLQFLFQFQFLKVFSTGRTFDLHFTVECAGIKGRGSARLQGGSTIWCNTTLPATGSPARRNGGSHTADLAVTTQLGQVALVLHSTLRLYVVALPRVPGFESRTDKRESESLPGYAIPILFILFFLHSKIQRMHDILLMLVCR